jgi:hypothetical protein
MAIFRGQHEMQEIWADTVRCEKKFRTKSLKCMIQLQMNCD